MKINQLLIISELINRCLKEEIKTFKAYLKTFDSGLSEYRSKSLQLLNLMLKKKNIEEDYLCRKIYGNVNPKSKQSFKRLVNRFKSKLYESLSLDINVYRQGSFTELVQYAFELRKLVLFTTILRGKILEQELIRIIDRGIYLAKEYELLNDLVTILYMKIEVSRLGGKIEIIKNLHKEIEFYINYQKAINISIDWYQNLVILPGGKAHGYDDLADFNKAIKENNINFAKYKSPNIKHYSLIIEMEYAHKLYDYKKAELISYEQIELYKKSKAVYLKGRMGSAYINLGNNLLYQYKFKEAIKSIQDSYPYYSKSNYINLYIAQEIESIVHFYSGNLIKSEEILRYLLSLGSKAGNPFSFSKRSFLLASVLVLKKQRKEAHQLLQETKEIEKDKEGWNLGIRILSIINQLEADKTDIADSSIESMRKHIDRTIKMKAIRKRDAIILKVLAALARQGFNFKAVWKKHQRYFELLSSNDAEYRWEIKSPEMIIFHKWFEAKAKGKDYDYVLKQE